MIPMHTLTLFAGEGGIGKSQFLLDIAAKVSTGEKFYAGGFDHQLKKGKVLMLTAEDDVNYTVKPMLIANGANCDEIEISRFLIGDVSKKKTFIDLTTKLVLFEEKIKSMEGIKLIIIDPIVYFTGEMNDNLNPDVANFLNSLIDLSKKYDLAIIITRHFRKKGSGKSITSASDEVGGAGAWTNTPRLNWAITRHHEDPLLLVISNIKVNIAKAKNEVFSYRIKEAVIHDLNGNSILTTKIEWSDKLVSMTANEAVNKDNFDKSKKQIAYEFIVNWLTDKGQSVAKHIKDAALKEGVKLKTFEYAVQQVKEEKLIKETSGVSGNKIWDLVKTEY